MYSQWFRGDGCQGVQRAVSVWFRGDGCQGVQRAVSVWFGTDWVKLQKGYVERNVIFSHGKNEKDKQTPQKETKEGEETASPNTTLGDTLDVLLLGRQQDHPNRFLCAVFDKPKKKFVTIWVCNNGQ